MNSLNRCLRMGLPVFLAVVLASCAVLQQVVKKPSVQVQSVNFHAQGLREGLLDSRLRIYNPNGFALPVRTLSYHLMINGHELVQGKLAFKKEIPARGSLELSLPVRFQYQQVLRGIDSMLQQRQVSYQLAGELDLELVQIPFSQSGQLGLRF